MYRNKDILCMQIFELQVIADLVRIFDKDVAQRIQNLYWYHVKTLKESNTNKIFINLPEALRKRPFQFSRVLQPELFVDYICVQDQN